ncbi:rhomboid family intramembrane serine protease [Epibacterium sp. SM1969]|uniref:Rhomboid family intramembrane serine protease n=1 Tax=Tritonibacter aquimaris TaxID=2663379 RepID=A0A844AQ16_9RHOB|nr:rhomboid family intramembrane serine protease [Tritonibacter aquimaris]
MFPLRDHTPSQNVPFVTISLIVLNSVIYIYTLQIIDLAEFQTLLLRFGVLPAAWPEDGNFNTLFTYMFMHAGFLHLVGNMMFLWVFGDNLEHQMGPFWYLVFYLSCGVVAAVVHAIALPHSEQPLIGASGAIFGVMGAYFLLYPRAKIDILVILIIIPRIFTISALWLLGGRLALDVFWVLQADTNLSQVAHWAHIGGFAAGLILCLPLWLALGATAFWRSAPTAPPKPASNQGRPRNKTRSGPRGDARAQKKPATSGKSGPWGK